LRHLIIIVFALSSLYSKAQNFLSWQYNDRYFSIQAGSGHSMYLGELNSSYTVQNLPSNATLAVEARLLSRLSARLEGSRYLLKAGDYNAADGSYERQRNLSFFSTNYEFTLQSVWFMKPYEGDFFKRLPIDPYLSFGVGFSTYDPMTRFNGQDVQLRPLKTENVEYGKSTLILPASIGLKLKVNDFINLMLEVSYRYTFTDYLDDVSTVYPEVSEDNVRSLLINRKNEVAVINSDAYQRIVSGSARGDSRFNDQYILFSYRLEFYIPNNKGPIFRKPSAYQ
jgi:hypothetical protein